ncbi:MAG: low specificity L-threonine aldolase [Planctomycetota bacterium]|nr:low specificity L-threonine aldolase [Planctomycetota bacterium]
MEPTTPAPGIPGCQFASDNTAGISPAALQALSDASQGFAASYGDDAWTTRLSQRLREWFETDCEMFLVFNGTAANSLALASLCQSYHSVICTDVSHIETDECGGPEFFSNGSKLLVAPSHNGKLNPEDVRHLVTKRSDIHYPKPRVVSITQSTELGTVYTCDELLALRDVKKSGNLRMHMDGARFANAVAALGCTPRQCTWEVGVDVLCLGGTKNGLPMSEIVLFFDRELAKEFDYRCKQAGQLASKMRFLSAPWLGLLENDLWLSNGRHANACARQLAEELSKIPQIRLRGPQEANAVFAEMPPRWVAELHRRGWRFYSFIGSASARFMCSWATQQADIAALLRDIRDVAAQEGGDPSV